MKSNRFTLFFHHLGSSLMAMLLVMVTTVPMFLIGRSVLGEGVIALAYLLPVTWSAYRWGQPAGISAAITAALAFNFLFIPPFFTFVIGRLEGWLLLAIFLAVAIILVRWIQTGLTRAREAVFMYEMADALANQRSPEGVAYSVARQIRQLFQAALVNVLFCPDKQIPTVAVSEPENAAASGKPDRIVPIYNDWGLVGEIQIWRGMFLDLPPVDGKLFQNFARQAGRAYERTQLTEGEKYSSKTMNSTTSRK